MLPLYSQLTGSLAGVQLQLTGLTTGGESLHWVGEVRQLENDLLIQIVALSQ
jgi:hypothetical protein